jgi:HEAT repeat protein
LPGENIKLCYGLSNTLPWLLSTMIILAVAMLEELKMKRLYGESYESYRKRAPFLFPLPRVIAQVFNLPLRLTFKKEYPDRKREIVAVLAFYTCLCLGVSVFYGGLVRLSDGRREASAQQVEKLVRILREADNFGEKRRAAGELEKIGEPAMESLIALLNDRVSQLRAYSAGALGVIKSERVIAPLITLLHDSDSYVRSTAAASLGRTGSPLAIPSLVEAMRDPKKDVVSAAVRALGEVRHPDVVPHLIRALRDTTLGAAGPAAAALGELGAQEAVEPLIHCFEDMPTCPYDVVGEALWKLNSDRAADAWILGLKKGSWWYPRSACAAALGRIKSQKGIESLIGALKDESEQVRRAAVLALMEIGSEKPRGALEAVRADSDLEVRIYAAEALKRIGTIK